MTTSYKTKRIPFTAVPLIVVLLSFITLSCSESKNDGQITTDQVKHVLKKASMTVKDAVLQTVDVLREEMQLPHRVGDWELYDVKADGEALVYEYRALSVNTNAVSGSQNQLQNQVCATSDMRFSLDLGITFVYRYYDSAGNVLEEVSVSSSDCSQ